MKSTLATTKWPRSKLGAGVLNWGFHNPCILRYLCDWYSLSTIFVIYCILNIWKSLSSFHVRILFEKRFHYKFINLNYLFPGLPRCSVGCCCCHNWKTKWQPEGGSYKNPFSVRFHGKHWLDWIFNYTMATHLSIKWQNV